MLKLISLFASLDRHGGKSIFKLITQKGELLRVKWQTFLSDDSFWDNFAFNPTGGEGGGRQKSAPLNIFGCCFLTHVYMLV